MTESLRLFTLSRNGFILALALICLLWGVPVLAENECGEPPEGGGLLPVIKITTIGKPAVLNTVSAIPGTG